MSEMNSTRRQFMKIAATFGSLAVLMPTLTQAAEERRKAKPAESAAGAGGDLDLPLVKPGVGMAAGVNYQHSQKDIKDKTLKVERQGVAFDKQHCNACMLFTGVGKKGADEVGKCTLFAGQLVKGQGWCASWSKKA
jgi:hypothetical protein